MTEDSEWVSIGVILGAHALRGGVRVKPLTRSPEEFLTAPLEKVHLRQKGRVGRSLTIEDRQLYKNDLLVTFKEIRDRTEAEALRGSELLIPEAELWELPENVFFMWELEGIELVDEETGRSLGTVREAKEGAAHDYLVFPNPKNPENEVMLPLVDEFVPEIDLKKRRALVKLPEGLLDL